MEGFCDVQWAKKMKADFLQLQGSFSESNMSEASSSLVRGGVLAYLSLLCLYASCLHMKCFLLSVSFSFTCPSAMNSWRKSAFCFSYKYI